MGFRQNVAEARKLLADAGYPGGRGFPILSIMTSHDDPFVRAVVSTLRRNPGIQAVQEIEDPGVEGAKEDEAQPARFVGYFSTGYTGILAWREWVSSNYSPSQTELLSLKPGDYTHYQVLRARGTARSLAAADKFLRAHASPQSRRSPPWQPLLTRPRIPNEPPRCTRKRRPPGRVRSSPSRTSTAIGSTRFALASRAFTCGPATSRSPSRTSG